MVHNPSVSNWVAAYILVQLGGKGSGYHGHKGRPGEVGGSSPDNIPNATAKASSLPSTYKIANGSVIYRVAAGDELPPDLIQDISDADEMFVRFIYNSKSNNWHIASKGLDVVDHGNFVTEALDGIDAKFTEQIQARGVYDLEKNELTVYNFIEDAENIAEWNEISTKQVEKQIEAVNDDMANNLFTFLGEEPKIEWMSMAELFGQFSAGPIYYELGGKGSGNFKHKGRPGEVGGSAPDDIYQPDLPGMEDTLTLKKFTPGKKSEMAKELDHQFDDEWADIIGIQAKEALGEYSGDKHMLVNGHLRGNLDLEEFVSGEDEIDEAMADIEIDADAIDSAIFKSPGFERDTLLYRGIDYDPDLDVGDEFEDHGFVSTSLDRNEALGFSSKYTEGDEIKNTMFEIVWPKRKPMAYMKPVSYHPSEYEVLLPRATSFRVSDMRDENIQHPNGKSFPFRIYKIHPVFYSE